MHVRKIHIGSRKHILSSEIRYLKSDINYTMIYLKSGENIFVSTNLGKIEARLSDLGFFRASRSCVVNLDFVKNYRENENFGKLELDNRVSIPISRRKTKLFKILKSNYLTQLQS